MYVKVQAHDTNEPGSVFALYIYYLAHHKLLDIMYLTIIHLSLWDSNPPYVGCDLNNLPLSESFTHLVNITLPHRNVLLIFPKYPILLSNNYLLL